MSGMTEFLFVIFYLFPSCKVDSPGIKMKRFFFFFFILQDSFCLKWNEEAFLSFWKMQDNWKDFFSLLFESFFFFFTKELETNASLSQQNWGIQFVCLHVRKNYIFNITRWRKDKSNSVIIIQHFLHMRHLRDKYQFNQFQ